MAVDVLLGLQWGDEGKGKIVDFLANDYDMIARFQGGPNAGHTLKIGDTTVVLHTIPSGIFHDHVQNIIGNGVVIDPVTFKKEVEKISGLGIAVVKNLWISQKAHLILPTHQLLDAASEAAKGAGKIGSTLKGIGPAYMDKTGRNGLRVGSIDEPDFRQQYQRIKDRHEKMLAHFDYPYDLTEREQAWWEGIEMIKAMNRTDITYLMHDSLASGKKVLAEGAQGSLLDIDFGTYPFVTSSNTISASACIGLGIPPSRIREVIGITKAYCTRVGSGPFPTELHDATGELLRAKGHEFGATTGRPRRCGWLDLPALKYSILLNGVSQLVITKIDVLDEFDTIKICTAYHADEKDNGQLPYNLDFDTSDLQFRTFPGWQQPLTGFDQYDELPEAVQHLLSYIEHQTQTDIRMLSTGPERSELIVRTVNV